MSNSFSNGSATQLPQIVSAVTNTRLGSVTTMLVRLPTPIAEEIEEFVNRKRTGQLTIHSKDGELLAIDIFRARRVK